jgi:hypothetical protein
MLIDPQSLEHDLDRLEDIEKATLRLVVQALYDFRTTAVDIFRAEADLVADIGEDVTREAMDRLGMSKVDQRLFGKIDYKRARYLFQPEYAVMQALFVDSKAEKSDGHRTATLQTSQLSMVVRQKRADREIAEPGTLPKLLDINGLKFVTTTLFVKYNYDESQDGRHELVSMTVAALPNGLLQERYNPTVQDTIWLAGRDAPTLGEAFRVRLSFPKLRQKQRWRVQTIPVPPYAFIWSE